MTKNKYLTSLKVSKVAKIRNRYNQVPHLTQDTNGKVTNSQKTPQTRAKSRRVEDVSALRDLSNLKITGHALPAIIINHANRTPLTLVILNTA